MESVALGLGFYGAANTSLNLLERFVKILLSLPKRLKDMEDFPAKLGKLIQLSKKISTVVENIKAKVDRYPRNVLETMESGLVIVFKDEVEQNLTDADNVLKKLEKYQEPSAGPSSGMTKFRKQVILTTKMDSISKVLNEFESCLRKTLDAASNFEVHRLHVENHRINIELQRKIDEAVCSMQSKSDEFIAHFDCPELPGNVVLDFDSTETQEGRLLRKLLELCTNENEDGMSAVGCRRGSATQGMGGVSKTTTLRAICYREEVKKAFPDGICFLEFGQDSKDGDVQLQLERCIENFGGESIVSKMEQQSSLEGAVHQAARWLRKKAVLFVCDNLWGSPTSEFGYLPQLKRMLTNAPCSKLLISTRDKKIAEELSQNYEPFGTLPPTGPSARHLLGQIAFEDRHTEILKRPDIQGYVETILNVCAGLQLALCMAGRALRIAAEEQGDIHDVFEGYACRLERDRRPDEAERGAQLYCHGLSYIVDASLVQCEQYAEKFLKKVDVRDLFLSLCVLEKQTAMPRSMLLNLWGLSSRKTDEIVRKFADLGLLTKTKCAKRSESSHYETREDYEIGLHDLILVLCQEEVGDEQEERHGRVIDALQRSRSVWIREKIPAPGEWWELKNNYYVYGNLSRHMVRCGRTEALANLLSDVRWTVRRLAVGGWLALKNDFELLVEGMDNEELMNVCPFYEVLKRHWSEFLIDDRFLTYYIGGSLPKERINKCTALYMDKMIRYLPRPLLIPRWKFLGPEDSRESSLLTCLSNSYIAPLMDFSRLADKAIIVGSGDQISVWSLRAQRELYSFSLRSLSVTCVAISADGRLIVSGFADGTFQLWDAESGVPVGARVQAHRKRVNCVGISRDGSTIISGSKDKTLRLWKTKNGEPKGVPMNHKREVTCVAICESGMMIVSGSRDGTVCRWNFETGAMMGKPMRGHKNEVSCVSVDENGKMIVSGSKDKTLLCWDGKTGEQIGQRMRGHSLEITCVAISACGRMIVSGSWDKTLRLWETVKGEPMGEPFRGHFSFVVYVEFVNESRTIVSGSNDGTIRQWRTGAGAQIAESTQRCEGGVEKIVFSDSGLKFVTCSRLGTLLQWDTSTGERLGKPMNATLDNVISIAINEKCGIIFAVYADSAGKEHEVIRWSMSTCEMMGGPLVIEQGSCLTWATLSLNGKMIVTGSEEGTVQRYCADSGNAIGNPMHGHIGEVTCGEFCNNDDIILTGSDDNTIIRWDAAGGRKVGKRLFHNHAVTCFSTSNDGAVIVSCTNLGSLYCWDAVSGQLMGKSLRRGANYIWTNSDCTRIVTWLRWDKTIRWWNVAARGAILEADDLPLSTDVRFCAVDMNKRVAVVALLNGEVAVCDIHV